MRSEWMGWRMKRVASGSNLSGFSVVRNWTVPPRVQKSKNGGGPFTTDSNISNQTQRGEVDFLLDAIDRIYEELNEIKNTQNNNE